MGAAAGSLVSGTVAGMEAADAQQDAANQARKRERLMMFQNAMENVRRTNLAMATSAVSFQGSGADLESSGAQGVRSSLGAQGSFNNTMLTQGGQISDRYWNYMREAADARGRQALWGSLAQGFSMLNTVLPQGGITGTTPTVQQQATQQIYNPPPQLPGVPGGGGLPGR